MTFLLFLTSLAVIEYLTRRETTPRRNPPKLPPKLPEAEIEKAPAVPTQGLAALGNALDMYGRGNTPRTVADTPQTTTSAVDRVK